MKQILVIGAGRSAVTLIDYLLKESHLNLWKVTIADYNLNLAENLASNNSNARPIFFNVNDEQQRENEIRNSDIVVSMLPSNMHYLVAKDCLKFKKNLVTASYVSDQIKAYDELARKNNIIFLNEIGLDPGIDHMSAMKVIDELRLKKAKLLSFKSYCGGLIHPESDNNPWNYKFTWNPRNVVLAGQGNPAKYIINNKHKYIPYYRLFKNTKKIQVIGHGLFEVYPNRDSLKYREIYGLNEIQTMIRGTIRKVGFSESWDMFVKLGLTNDSFKISNSNNMSYREYLNCFLPYDDQLQIEEKLAKVLSISKGDENWEKLKEIDILSSNKKIPLKNASPAQILEYILKDSWRLEKKDKDMIVMYHEFGYETSIGEKEKIISTMVCKGKDDTYTAMAKTVGLPLAISSILLLNNKINLTGIHTPIDKEIYNPVLKELEANGINFEEY